MLKAWSRAISSKNCSSGAGNDQPPKEKANIDKQCDFDKYPEVRFNFVIISDYRSDVSAQLSRCFEALGLGTPADINGGPNRCYNVEHWGGPFVRKVFGRVPAKVYYGP